MDKSLLEKDGVPTTDELKEFFRNNDYSTAVSSFDYEKADSNTNKTYIRAKKIFSDYWCKNMGSFGGKDSLLNFTNDYPVKTLEKADENYVAGSVMEVISSEQATANAYDVFFSAVQEPLMAEIEKAAKENNKGIDDLTDDEIMAAVDHIADEFLNQMMNLMMQSQSVPEILGITNQNAAHEDFNNNIELNYSKKDFEKKWDHTRTKIGELFSLDDISKDDSAYASHIDFEDMIMQKQLGELGKRFLDSLSDTDREIILLRQKKYTQDEIAKSLGYKNHSGVTKRLKAIRKSLDKFIDKNLK